VAANAVGHPDYPDRVRRIDLLAQVRRVLSSREFGLFRDVLEKTDTGWAKEILSVVQRNHGLTDHIRVQMLEILARVHPAPAVKAIAPWDDEEVVYTSAAALDDKRKEFEHLLHVKLPANSTAIGDAAARGDLSENAEFTAALEERDRLTERANAMQADLARAKVVSSFWAHGDAVHIGTTVRARRLSTGAEEMLTFLGPWDADMKKFIYYYKAPLAKAFMGKRVGETVTLKAESGSEQWEILEIRPAV
jgi:transcription elongation factor GreA